MFQVLGLQVLAFVFVSGKPKLGLGEDEKVRVCMKDGTEIEEDEALCLLPLEEPLTLEPVSSKRQQGRYHLITLHAVS